MYTDKISSKFYSLRTTFRAVRKCKFESKVAFKLEPFKQRKNNFTTCKWCIFTGRKQRHHNEEAEASKMVYSKQKEHTF